MAKPTAAKLVELAAQLVTLAVEMTSQPQADATAPAGDRLLTADEIAKVRPVTRGWLKTKGTPRGKGSRQRPLYDLAEVDAAIKANPPRPRPKKCTPIEVGDELDALLASGAVRR